MASGNVSRRGLLKGLTFGAFAGVPMVATNAKAAPEGRALRVAFLTDLHLMRQRPESYNGIAYTVDQLLSLDDVPDLLVTGGDHLTNGMFDRERGVLRMRELWDKVWTPARAIRWLPCVGNHDVWGWVRNASQTTGDEPLWGKNFAKELLRLDRTYYSSVHNGWKFLVLDSIQPYDNHYRGGIDPEQMEWLAGELGGTPSTMPIAVVCHIPIVSAGAMLVDGLRRDGLHTTESRFMLENAYEVASLLHKHPNVKLVLSGHSHVEECVQIGGCMHLNGGAVCGGWWQHTRPTVMNHSVAASELPRLPRAAPGYTILDLMKDGTFRWEQVQSGWKPFAA